MEVAAVGYDETLPFFANARIPNATGELVYTIDITPGSANRLPGPISGLVINEISAAGSTGTDEAGDHDDFIELYNGGTEPINLNGLVISDDPANPVKSGLRDPSELKLLQHGVYHVIWLDEEQEEGPDHVSFKLSSDGEPVTIRQFTPTGLMPVASIDFGVQLSGFSLSRIPDATGEFVQTFSATPGQKNKEVTPVNGLVINELSPVESSFTDAFGEQDDWVELYNSGTEPVNLSGLFLSDKAGQPVRHLLNRDYADWPLQPGEFALLWTDGQPEQGYDHLPMKLSTAGETITLAQVTRGDTLILDHYTYPVHPEGQALARLPDGTGNFSYTSTPSPGAKNSGDDNSVDFYPNPADDELNLLVRSGDTRVQVIDRLGKTMVDRFFPEPAYRTMDLSGLSSGIYFIRITGIEGTQTSRLAVIR